MPSAPIAIAIDRYSQSVSSPPPMSSSLPESAVSVSPQTPSSPPVGQHIRSASLTANSAFFKWAAAAASLGKSPTSDIYSGPKPPAGGGVSGPRPDATSTTSPPLHQARAVSEAGAVPVPTDIEQHEENHDSFEIGDLEGFAARGWKPRRAVSMSTPSRPSGITSMLSGFGATSPPVTGNQNNELGTSLSTGTGLSPSQSAVLADKAAKGQGVLRRLSIGSGFTRPFAYANVPQSASLPTAVSEQSAPTSIPPPESSTPTPAFPFVESDQGLQRGPVRGRRFSESKKRGVSPMGERILRDQVHF